MAAIIPHSRKTLISGTPLALAGLRQRYPDDSPSQRRRRLADLILGTELAARAYGPMPEEEE